MIKFSKLADYAVVILSVLSKSDGQRLSASAISAVTHIPEPTVSKVTKKLSKAGLVDSTRGAAGGYKLSRQSNDISVATIVTAVDGPIALAACVEHGVDDCSFAMQCPSKGRWDAVNDAIEKTLEDISLSDMVRRDYSFTMPNDKEEGLRA